MALAFSMQASIGGAPRNFRTSILRAPESNDPEEGGTLRGILHDPKQWDDGNVSFRFKKDAQNGYSPPANSKYNQQGQPSCS